ncbi:hypothetical protein Q1695_003797 [Nippostrongylus brasiliensis]|nr:hypothetical protein Q1695_003797 [Nippostrongylus brasiliensis]
MKCWRIAPRLPQDEANRRTQRRQSGGEGKRGGWWRSREDYEQRKRAHGAVECQQRERSEVVTLGAAAKDRNGPVLP